MMGDEKCKNLDDWHIIKKQIQTKQQESIFHEREVWWYAAGENVGSEINGKGGHFARPVVIMRKYGDEGFFGVPLSSKTHIGFWYYSFCLKGKNQCALLSQARTYSVYRLYSRIGRIKQKDYDELRRRLALLLLRK